MAPRRVQSGEYLSLQIRCLQKPKPELESTIFSASQAGVFLLMRMVRRESGGFDIAISYSVILGENNPAVLPDDRESFFVSGIGRKVIIVEVDGCSRVA
jgi:hypothetical protein